MKTIIPAEAGWHLLTPVHQDRTVVRVHMEPVIAWHIASYQTDPFDSVPQHQVTPVTVEMQNADCTHILRSPSGEVFELGVRSFGIISPAFVAEDSELIERFNALNKIRGQGPTTQAPDAQKIKFLAGASMSREEAVALLEQALARIKHPQENAHGGEMQASGAYWRLARVLSDYLLPAMQEVHPAEHVHFITMTHGTLQKPGN